MNRVLQILKSSMNIKMKAMRQQCILSLELEPHYVRLCVLHKKNEKKAIFE